MKRRGVIRRSAVAGIAIASATLIVSAGTGGAALAKPTAPSSAEPAHKVAGAHGDSKPSKGKTSAIVPDSYIVVLKGKMATPGQRKAAATALTKGNGGTVRRVFEKALNGYSATMTRQQADRLAANSDVAYVEPVRTMSTSGTQTSPPSWGLDRVDQASPKLDGSYSYPTTGAGVTAFVIDTGIDVAHEDFGGRAVSGYDFVDQDDVAEDCDGHGTHVAGTIGGTRFGVAKDVKLVGLRVFPCVGGARTDHIVAAIDWATTHKTGPSVVNLSLGGYDEGNYQAVTNAINNSIANGLTYAVAAGNDYDDACYYSPANVSAAITVGATDMVDYRSWWTNYGSCIDIYAPGMSIVSAAAGTGNGSVSFNGTSMASPHVAGAAALLLEANPTWSPAQVRDTIVSTGIAGAVHNPWGGVDRLLNVAAAVSPARDAHGLRARSNGKFVSADGAGSKPLVNNGPAFGAWERFDIVDAGSGLVALRAKVNGKFVSADGAGSKPLIANGPAISTWEKFQLINNADGTVSLRAIVNNKFVSAPNTGGTLIANAPSASTWEKFFVEAPNPIVTIRSAASGLYVSADGAGSKPLIPLASTASTWEKFEMVDIGYGYFALRSLANGKYVSAEGAGSKPLIASGPAVSDWEIFDLPWYRGDGSIWLRADIDQQAVSAGSAGTSQLIPNKNFNDELDDFGLSAGERYFINPA
ncbi:S8 family serine peptidase [Micromonospora sp. NPDC093244]|uniref:S8 family serine peptidase n=1 Tax=Micromonospora sp. NPDC093244 TaxID=3155071 RepID=UPI00342EC033